MALTPQQFQDLLANLTPQMIQELLTMRTPYSQEIGTNPKEVVDSLDKFKLILFVVLQLQVCFDYEGITRYDAIQFIAFFNKYLTPTYEAATIRTNTVGQEISRILNHMALSMQTW